MTVKELLAEQSFLQTDEAGSGVYIIPHGKFGFTSFPVGEQKAVEKTRPRVLPEGYTIPEGISDEEREVLMTEHYTEVEFVLNENAVFVTPDEYYAVMNHEMCWENGKPVKYVESKAVGAAKKLVAEEQEKFSIKAEAQQWLNAHDYIGIKIAHVALVGTQEDIDAMRTEYADAIAEAQVKRTIINEVDEWLTKNKTALIEAKEIVFNEN